MNAKPFTGRLKLVDDCVLMPEGKDFGCLGGLAGDRQEAKANGSEIVRRWNSEPELRKAIKDSMFILAYLVGKDERQCLKLSMVADILNGALNSSSIPESGKV